MLEHFDESLERPYEPELDAQYIRELGSLGLYDARVDFYNFNYLSKYHPTDDRWPPLEIGD